MAGTIDTKETVTDETGPSMDDIQAARAAVNDVIARPHVGLHGRSRLTPSLIEGLAYHLARDACHSTFEMPRHGVQREVLECARDILRRGTHTLHADALARLSPTKR